VISDSLAVERAGSLGGGEWTIEAAGIAASPNLIQILKMLAKASVK
jgi:hypothetical protein